MRDERDTKRDNLVNEATHKIDEAIDAEYGERIKDLRLKSIAADKVVRDAEVADAIKDAPWPVGTKLIGWGRACGRYDHIYGDLKPLTKQVEGILEVVTDDTIHPATLSRYGRASVGSYIIRLIRKEGAVGIAY